MRCPLSRASMRTDIHLPASSTPWNRRANNDPFIPFPCYPATCSTGCTAGHHDGGRCSPARHSSAIDATCANFLRLLTGCGRINSEVARRIPGLYRDPKDRLSNLKQVEEALDVLIASNGEYCPLPLSQDVQAELFPEVRHARGERRTQRQNIAFTRKMRREARQVEQSWLLRQNLLGQAVTELNFQSPETVNSWYRRWSDEFDASELEPAFWRWQTRFTSLRDLHWLLCAHAPLYEVMHEIRFIVQESEESILERERWLVPNKLICRG